jgi:3-hydroxyisobutyrate dehydrogenase-like beta-hydroxyacid dehydrogenase
MTNTSITPPATIGFIGLGNMGKPMAKVLAAAGYKLCVSDLNADAIKTFCADTGATAASSLQQLGSVSRVVITMLPDGKAVRKVLMAPNGVVSGLSRRNPCRHELQLARRHPHAGAGTEGERF